MLVVAEKLELPSRIGGRKMIQLLWKWYEVTKKVKHPNYYMIQKSHFWVYTPKELKAEFQRVS